jgi:GNAT superfamily N-acetyltransferase
LSQVQILTLQLGYEATVDEIRERFRKIDALSTHALFVARDAEGKTVGYVHIFREMETLLSGERAELHTLVVDESVRGRKFGTQLLIKAETWAKSQGVNSIRLRSNISREDAHRFYLRHGYETQKTSYTFIKTV